MKEVLKECALFVKELHKGQVDKGGKEYHHHLYEVAENAKELCGKLKKVEYVNECVLIGLLHDSVEDCGLDFEVIKEKYGEVVASGVDFMTKKESGFENDERKDPLFDVKYVSYLVHLFSEFKKGNKVAEIAMIVKMADLKSNMNWKRLGVESFAELTVKQKKDVAKYHFAYCLLMSVLLGTVVVGVKSFELMLKTVKYDESELESAVENVLK